MGTSGKPSLTDSGTLQDFITRIAQGIYIVTPDGRILDANPALLEIFGASSLEELQRYRSEDLVPYPGHLKERRRLLAEQGWLRNYEYEIRRLDGTIRRVRDTVFTQRDENGQVVALHGILSDVTGEGERLPGAGRTDTPLTSFFTGAPAGLAILDRELRFIRINQTMAMMHRLPVEAHIGRPLAEAVPGLAPALEPILNRVLSTGRPTLNFEITTADHDLSGDVRHWRFSCFPLGPAEEDPTSLGVIVVDVTDSKRIEHEVRRDHQYLSVMIENSPLAMVTLDQDNRVVSANQAFEKMFLYSRAEASGRDIDELIAPADEMVEARALSERIKSGEFIRCQSHRKRKDGTSVEVGIFGAPIVLDGVQVGAYGIYEDLTERRLLT